MTRALRIVWILAAMTGCAFPAHAGRGAASGAYPFILWDGHRFARTAAEHERDIRYIKDLGFTHTLVTGWFDPARAVKDAQRVGPLLELCEKYDIHAGLRFPWEFKHLDIPWEQMVARGMTLRARPTGKHDDFNPVHPEIVRYCRDGLVRAIEIYRRRDPHGRIDWFLLGSERTWQFPKRSDVPPAAVEVILQAARADGVTGADEGDWDALEWWWNGAHGHGRDYRIRQAFEDAMLERIPDADFMVDPFWAVKIVHGFGGSWSYVGEYPIGMADGVVRIKAVCWPAPAAHSVQLIRGPSHDNVLEGDLLSLCMGIDKLYHFGLSTFEPGRHWAYRYEGERTPEARRRLTAEFLETRRRLEPALRSAGRLVRDRGELLANWKPMGPRVAMVVNVYRQTGLYLSLMAEHVPFDLMISPEHRRSELPKAGYAWVVPTKPDEALYGLLRQVDRAGGTVFVPKGFKPPAGAAALSRTVEWNPAFIGKRLRTLRGVHFDGGGPDEMRTYLHQRARYVRRLCRQAGLKPYFDSESLDLVMQPYVYKGHAMLFVVNDKREPFDTGRPNDVEILLRDRTDGLKVIDIDTGGAMALERSDEGWTFRDTIAPAWYKIYAVVKPGQPYAGPPPLPAGPAVVALTASAHPEGVKLTWKLPLKDWVGCDVARYRVYRAGPDGKEALLADIPGRIMTGPGGVVTDYIDKTADRATGCTYRLRTVTPLRIEGPLSAKAATP